MGNPLTHNYLFDSIEKMSCDFCFVQETFISSESLIKAVSHRWLGRSFWSPAIGRQGGVATLISPRISDEVISWKKDSHGRIVSILIRTTDVDLNSINIYAPPIHLNEKFFSTPYMTFLFRPRRLSLAAILTVMTTLQTNLGATSLFLKITSH